VFLSSPFSLEAVELLKGIGVVAWKAASGEVSNPAMLNAMAGTGLPVLLSTGMSGVDEIDAAVARLGGHGAGFAVMQCTSAYPCPPEKVGLNMIDFFRRRYGAPSGLSDHSGTIYPGLAAATLGAEVLEVHVTLSREMFGPDAPVSLTTLELRQLVEGVRYIERMRAAPVNKDRLACELLPLRDMFTKSVVARIDLPAGTVLGPAHVAYKKPGTGIPAARANSLFGRRLRRAVAADQMLQDGDLEAVKQAVLV
jgi:N-acetylneuraminate synthase